MALNQLGLGFVFTAKDQFTGVANEVAKRFQTIRVESDKASAVVEKNMGAIRDLGLGVAAAGAAGVAFFGVATAAAQKFGAGIAGVSTLVDEHVLSMRQLEEIALGMNEFYGGGIDAQIKALYQGLSSGATDAATATSLLDASNRLAIGGMAGVEASLDGLTNTLNAFAIDYSKATDVADAFFVATKIGKTTVEELSHSVGQLAPTAAAVNVSFDEMLSSIAAVTTQGLNTRAAITGLSAAFANIIKPTADAAAEAARLGIKFDAKSLRERGFHGFLESITKAARFNADSLSKLFGSVDALNAVMALTAQGGKQFNATLEEMAHRTGAADKAFEKMAATAAHQATRFKALGENALILVGKALEPMATAVLKVANVMIEGFTKLPGPVLQTIVRIAAAAAAIASLVGTIVAAKAAFAIWVIGLKAAGVTLLGVAQAFLPVLAAIAALGLALYGLREAYEKNIGGFGDAVRTMAAKVTLAVSALRQVFGEGGFSGDVRKALNTAENAGVKAFAINVFLWFNRIKNLVGGVMAGFADGVRVARPAIEGFMGAIQKLGEAFGFMAKLDPAEKNRTAWVQFGEVGARVGRAVASAFEMLIEVGTVLAEVARGMVIEFRENGDVMGILVNAGKALWAALGNLAAAFGMGDGGATGTAVAFGRALMVIIELAARTAAVVVGVAAALTNVLASAIGGVISMLKTLWATFVALLAGITALLTGDWAVAWTAAKDVVGGVVKFIVQALTALLGAIGGFVDSIASTFGKDLGLKKAIEGGALDMQRDLDVKLGVKSSPIVMPSAAPVGSASPAVAAMEMSRAPAAMARSDNAAILSALQSQASRPPDNISVPVILDGEVIAKAMVSRARQGGTRAFSPMPPLTSGG